MTNQQPGRHRKAPDKPGPGLFIASLWLIVVALFLTDGWGRILCLTLTAVNFTVILIMHFRRAMYEVTAGAMKEVEKR